MKRADHWIWVSDLAGHREPQEGTNEDAWRLEKRMYGASQTVSALWRLSQCLDHLSTLGHVFEGRLNKLVEGYQLAFAEDELHEARDRLEHLEDRVTHLKMQRFEAKKHDRPHAEIFHEADWGENGLRHVTVLRQKFKVYNALTLAKIMEPLIFEEVKATEKAMLAAYRHAILERGGTLVDHDDEPRSAS